MSKLTETAETIQKLGKRLQQAEEEVAALQPALDQLAELEVSHELGEDGLDPKQRKALDRAVQRGEQAVRKQEPLRKRVRAAAEKWRALRLEEVKVEGQQAQVELRQLEAERTTLGERLEELDDDWEHARARASRAGAETYRIGSGLSADEVAALAVLSLNGESTAKE